MSIFVTGGAGFIGSNFIRLLLNSGHKVTNVDSLTYAANPETIRDFEKNPNYRFVNADIRDKKAMYDVIDKGSFVFNFAAESHVDNSIRNPYIFLETNVFGVQNLLEVCKDKKARPVCSD